MARPKSMSDFAKLLDTSYSPIIGVPERERPRKKPSISLAAGLIMAAESQSPRGIAMSTQHTNGTIQAAESSDSLFYAYALKRGYSQSRPNVLAFASASVASQWWSLVKQEYPQSERAGSQLFILDGNNMPGEIQENVRFQHLQHQWFVLTDGTEVNTATSVIPIQNHHGNPLFSVHTPDPNHTSISEPKPQDQNSETGFNLTTISETLDKLNIMISENTSHIRALSVAQSEGLRRMQEINEANTTQIKALADSQSKLQLMIEHNATHYLALSNSSFAAQEQVKNVLQTNAEQIGALAESQNQMATTCSSLIKTIENLGGTVARVGEDVTQGLTTASAGSGAVGNPISPPPRKLNRKVKSVWYEYDESAGNMADSPRRGVGLVNVARKPSKTLKM